MEEGSDSPRCPGIISSDIQYFMSFPLVSADCVAVATEDDVCGCFLNIGSYLNWHHQRSFTEQKRVLSSYILKLFYDFFQENEVFNVTYQRASCGCDSGVQDFCR